MRSAPTQRGKRIHGGPVHHALRSKIYVGLLKCAAMLAQPAGSPRSPLGECDKSSCRNLCLGKLSEAEQSRFQYCQRLFLETRQSEPGPEIRTLLRAWGVVAMQERRKLKNKMRGKKRKRFTDESVLACVRSCAFIVVQLMGARTATQSMAILAHVVFGLVSEKSFAFHY